MSRSSDRGHCGVCVLGDCLCWWLDICHYSGLFSVEFADKFEEEGGSCYSSIDGCNVSSQLMLEERWLTQNSASAATIIRIPYIHTYKDQADFLYATTDVVIWSCAETGLGIAACSLATLRPLFRAFFSRSHLMGDSSSHKLTSNEWPTGAWPYQRSKSQGGTEEYGLRSDIRTSRDAVTIIESDRDLDLEGREPGGMWGSSVVRRLLRTGLAGEVVAKAKGHLRDPAERGELTRPRGSGSRIFRSRL